MTPTDIQRLRALAEKATPGPWKIVRDLHPHYLGTHEEFRIFTAWNHGQMKGPLPVVTMSTGIGEKRGDPPRQMVSMRADDVALLVEMDPATVIALCDLAEKAIPEPAQAQVSDATQRKLEIMGVALANISLGMHDHKEYAAQALHQAAQVEAAARARLPAPLPDGRS